LKKRRIKVMKEKTARRFINRNTWKIARVLVGIPEKPSFHKRVEKCFSTLLLPLPTNWK